MKLVFLVGAGAVGKMTIGEELCKITNLKLFYNHMMIEPVVSIFDDFDVDTVLELRRVIFKNFAKSDREGMVYTMLMDFDSEEEWQYVDEVRSIFESQGGEFYFVELTAPLEIRLERNKTENRRLKKPSKRDVSVSEWRVLEEEKLHRMESREGEVKYKNYLKIDTASLTAAQSAQLIKEHFSL